MSKTSPSLSKDSTHQTRSSEITSREMTESGDCVGRDLPERTPWPFSTRSRSHQAFITVEFVYKLLERPVPEVPFYHSSLPYQQHLPHKTPTDAQIAGGHKANLNNPNTSKESKENSKRILDNEFNGGDVHKASDTKDKNPGNVAGGLKA